MWVAIQKRFEEDDILKLPTTGTVEDHYEQEEPAEKYVNLSRTIVIFDEVLKKKRSLSFINDKNLEDFNFRDIHRDVYGIKGAFDSYGTVVQLAQRLPKKDENNFWSKHPEPVPEDGIILRHYGLDGFRVDFTNKFITRLKSAYETESKVIEKLLKWTFRTVRSRYYNSG